MDKPNFDFYACLRGWITEIESNENYNEEQLLRQWVFYIALDWASLTWDTCFIISKLTFNSFNDDKKYTRALLDILYSIAKELAVFQFRAVINWFETVHLGNYEAASMVFFIKALVTFNMTHEWVVRKWIKTGEDESQRSYANWFKDKFNSGYCKMRGLLSVIPWTRWNGDDEGEDRMWIYVFRIWHEEDEKRELSVSKNSFINMSDSNNNSNSMNFKGVKPTTPSTIGSIKQKSFIVAKDAFFTTEIKKEDL